MHRRFCRCPQLLKSIQAGANCLGKQVDLGSIWLTYPCVDVPKGGVFHVVDHDLKILVRVGPQVRKAELDKEGQVVLLHTHAERDQTRQTASPTYIHSILKICIVYIYIHKIWQSYMSLAPLHMNQSTFSTLPLPLPPGLDDQPAHGHASGEVPGRVAASTPCYSRGQHGQRVPFLFRLSCGLLHLPAIPQRGEALSSDNQKHIVQAIMSMGAVRPSLLNNVMQKRRM